MEFFNTEYHIFCNTNSNCVYWFGYALTKYENGIIKAADNHGKLSLSDVTICYDSEFKGAKGSDANGHPIESISLLVSEKHKPLQFILGKLLVI